MAQASKNNGKLIRSLLIESMSEDHIKIMDSLNEPKHDEDIAEELDVKATIIRTLLNDLHAENLVEYERTKNKKTGWYTYKWNRREDKVDEFVQGYLQKKLRNLNQQLDEQETGIIFSCRCENLSYDEALLKNFICEKCNSPHKEYDSAELVAKITTDIALINSLIEQT
ncbi:MAG: hypothetical protein ABH950_02540 [Candidatus Altiarchaeota archaeon]